MKVFKGALASYIPSLTKAYNRAMFTVPIEECATLISFIVTLETFGLRANPSRAEVNPIWTDSKTRSIAV